MEYVRCPWCNKETTTTLQEVTTFYKWIDPLPLVDFVFCNDGCEKAYDDDREAERVYWQWMTRMGYEPY